MNQNFDIRSLASLKQFNTKTDHYKVYSPKKIASWTFYAGNIHKSTKISEVFTKNVFEMTAYFEWREWELALILWRHCWVPRFAIKSEHSEVWVVWDCSSMIVLRC